MLWKQKVIIACFQRFMSLVGTNDCLQNAEMGWKSLKSKTETESIFSLILTYFAVFSQTLCYWFLFAWYYVSTYKMLRRRGKKNKTHTEQRLLTKYLTKLPGLPSRLGSLRGSRVPAHLKKHKHNHVHKTKTRLQSSILQISSTHTLKKNLLRQAGLGGLSL